MTQAVFVDCKAAVRAWVNANSALVGPGMPLPLGAHFQRLRSPYQGAFLLLAHIGGGDDYGAGVAQRARISGQVYGTTQQTADLAAIAYANAIRGLAKGNVGMVGAVCLTAGNIVGPLEADDGDEPRRLVDAEFMFRPL